MLLRSTLRLCCVPLVLLSGLFVSACAADEGPDGDRIWVLHEIDGRRFEARADLRFVGEDRIGGQAPCNSYGGARAGQWPAFVAGPLIATRRACPELAAESAFFAALEAMTTGRIDGDRLILTNDDGRSLVFSAASAD